MRRDATERCHLRKEPDAERQVIGALLLSTVNGDTDCTATAFDMLTAGDFADKDCRAIFTGMGQLRDRGEPMDTVLLARELRGEVEHAAGLLLELLAECRHNCPRRSLRSHRARCVASSAGRLCGQRHVK